MATEKGMALSNGSTHSDETMTRNGVLHDTIFARSIRTKRTHRKSRNGCSTCKRRRVKCDETQPRCTNCRIRGHECVYSEIPAALSPGTTPIPAFSTSSPGDQFEESDARSGAPLRDILSGLSAEALAKAGVPQEELARYYFDIAVPSFTRSSSRHEQHQMWLSFVPSLAFVSPAVRHGVLALGSISKHFAEQDEYIVPEAQRSKPPESQLPTVYFDAAVAHGEAFVKRSRLQIDRLLPCDANSNAACTHLLSVLAFAFCRHYRQMDVELDDPQAWTWLRLLRGVLAVHTSLLKSGQEVDPIVKQNMIPELFPLQTAAGVLPNLSPETGRILSFITDTSVERFDVLHAAVSSGALFPAHGELSTTNSQSAAFTAVTQLARINNHICQRHGVHSLFRALCSWPSDLSPHFVDLLTACNAGALAIFSHWLMLVALADDLWWMKGMSSYGIQAALDYIPETNINLQRVVEKPRQLLAMIARERNENEEEEGCSG